jgi:hypothetical protein
MKKIYFMLMSAAIISLVACGGEEKKDEKKDKGESEEEAEEPKEEEAKVDYSYVLPQIDTTALTTEVEILSAMEKVVVARKLDDSLASNVNGYSGYYTELTNLYATVLNKSTAYMGTLKSKDALVFNDKMTAITNKMYDK